MFTVITIPSNFVASTTAVASDFFSDLLPITTLILAVVIIAVVLEIIIGSMRK